MNSSQLTSDNYLPASGLINSVSPRWLIPAMLLCVSVWAIFVPPTLPRSYIYSWDSAAYIETARSIHAGRGLQQRVIHGTGQDFWQPIAWWPPGYPILIAALQTTGLSPEIAGVAIAISSAALGVMLLAFISLRLLGRTLSLPVMLTTILMPDFLQISVTCMSDATYFALLTASVACLICWSSRLAPSGMWLAAAGFLAGAAWTVRNVGLALFVATGIFLLAHLFWKPFREVAKYISIWLAGVAFCSIPLIIRNLVTFGGLSSYNMPPSNLSLWENINTAWEVIISDITASDIVADLMISRPGRVITVLVIIVALSVWGRRIIDYIRPRLISLLSQQRLPLLLLSYALVHISIVIMARTTYRWGEPITSRHAMPIYWIVWICLAIYGPALLRRAGLTDGVAKRATVAGLILACSLQLISQFQFLSQPPGQATTIQSELGDEAAAYLASDIAKDQIVLSTRADLLRTHCDVNARKIPPVAQYDYVNPISLEEIFHLGDTGFLWGLVIEDIMGARDGIFDLVIKDIVERIDDYPEFERISIDSPALILKYTGREKAQEKSPTP